MKKLLFSSVLVATLASSAFAGYYIDRYGNIRYQLDIHTAISNNKNANTNPQTDHQSIYSNAFCARIGCIR
ncbi:MULTISPECIES: hypothetical protein [Campylobacter]|uniref:Uncharacterized protein n=1 Tax=Campylobacter porcelli TaxID=1660073 RepID=A0ABU7M5M8_9BACT|nr:MULTISPECIES: hypothetical protein [unclassified Campylobacter]MCR8679641.1 hypothetical protein [Campylobacter sp. RM19072]MCR8696818.1 hypothetical protein [Campylobacter sp. RM19073]MEE3704615.1 hypothetical protein [Campylobacter sp. CX2-8023-23]MEE3745017.1 hypothetical protein [Campylobacter sp. CX2-4855-23]